MAYSEVGDLLIGDTYVDSVVDTQAIVNSCADEIDANIGFLYATPIEVPDTPVNRPTTLLLKMINNYLASGRILLIISRSGEAHDVDSLAKYYIGTATDRIKKICDGTIELLGAVRNVEEKSFQGPTIINAEPESLVDAFYNNFQRDPRFDRFSCQ